MEGIKIQMLYQALVLCMLVHLGYPQETEGEGGLFYYHQSEYPKDCQDIVSQCSNPDEIHDGVYVIKPEGLKEPIEVFCDITGGGWTVIQRRIDGGIDFNRNANSYKHGFGFLNHEFWIGNEILAHLTNQKETMLKIDMETTSGVGNVTYDWFRVSDENSSYKLVKLEGFTVVSGTGFTDEMSGSLSQTFKTINGTSSCSNWWSNDSSQATCDKGNMNVDYASLSWGGKSVINSQLSVGQRPSS